MTTINTTDLTGAALDWAVAEIEIAAGIYTRDSDDYSKALLQGESVFGPGNGKWEGNESGKYGIWQQRGASCGRFRPSTDPAFGQPIIERERMLVGPEFKNGDWYGDWRAVIFGFAGQGERAEATGPEHLIAAMRCYVTSKLGDAVEVPDELTTTSADQPTAP
jgi:hypothetical protein